MTAITFDTLACFKKLKHSGFPDEQAEILTEALTDIYYTMSLENLEKSNKRMMTILYWIWAIAIILICCEIVLMK